MKIINHLVNDILFEMKSIKKKYLKCITFLVRNFSHLIFRQYHLIRQQSENKYIINQESRPQLN